ncbi:MAG: DUF11 domain-containing protein [Candidatus Kerfeldbacteria bacterium]
MTKNHLRLITAVLSIIGIVGIAANAYGEEPLVPGDKILLLKPTLVVSNEADLSVAKPGDLVTYTVTIMNVGSGAATSVMLHAVLPEGFTLSTDGAATYDYTFLALLEPGTKVAASYTAKIGDGVVPGTYTSNATVTAASVDPLTSAASVMVKQPEVLGIQEEIAPPVDFTVPAVSIPRPQVLGVSDELAATGLGQLDVLIAFLGSCFVAVGVFGLLRTVRA